MIFILYLIVINQAKSLLMSVDIGGEMRLCKLGLHICFVLGSLFLTQSIPASTANDFCPVGSSIKSTDGIQRLALVVGIGQYISEKIDDLPGPPEDAKRFYELLTGKNGFGFPKENVCMLLDGQATTDNFKKKFIEQLINKSNKGDEVVFYYAGHGSQVKDTNSDEADGLDETFVLHDANQNGISEYTDDEFENLLKTLYGKTENITIILDSCNSGSAVRSTKSTQFLSRFVPKPELENARKSNNADSGWVSASYPGLVTFSAAGDGTWAHEKNGHGIFTDAILTTFAQPNSKTFTYSQAARQIRQLVKAESYQIPIFQGNLGRKVFSGNNSNKPLSWEVTKLSPKLELEGLPLPGIGKDAEMRVYDGASDDKDVQVLSKAKAIIVIDKTNIITATAHVSSSPKNAKPIKIGDIAVLMRPGDAQRHLNVSLSGIPSKRIKKLKNSLIKQDQAKQVIHFVSSKDDFEISMDSNGFYVIKGPENTIRSRFSKEEDVIENLYAHSKQRVFSSLQGEGGGLYTDQETLQVQAIPVPADQQESCTKGKMWSQEQPNSLIAQTIPICYKWNIKVKLSKNSPTKLLIGALILSTNGSIFGIPNDGRLETLEPDKEYTFRLAGETFQAGKPIGIHDQIIVFGTQENNPVYWRDLSMSFSRSIETVKRGKFGYLQHTLNRYLSGTRGIQKADDNLDAETAWTLSSIAVKVID